MHRRRLSLLVPALLLALAPAGTSAAPFDGRPKLLLHLSTPTGKNRCAAGGLIDCSSAVISGDLAPTSHFVYLLAARGDLTGLAGLQCGILYQGNCDEAQFDRKGVDISSWTLCATLQFPTPGPRTWPASGSGNLITWDATVACQTGGVGVAGYFYVTAYDADRLQIIPRPVDGLAKVADCGNAEAVVDGRELGSVEFSAGATTSGCNPCNGDCPEPVIPPPGPCTGPPVPPPPPGSGDPAMLFHVTRATGGNGCTIVPLDCDSAVVKGDLTPAGGPGYYFAYLLAAPNDLGSIMGMQCGITYEDGQPGDDQDGHGIDIFGWTLCADLEFQTPTPNWGKPGSGNVLFWSPCQTQSASVAGYFYVAAYSTDALRIIPRPLDGLARLADCANQDVTVPQNRLGWVSFSPGATIDGCNPCRVGCSVAVPVRPTTWSAIKSIGSE